MDRLISRLKENSSEGDILSQWELEGIYRCDEGAKCACGKSIKNVFVVYNGSTEIEENIGSECIKYFTGEKKSGIYAKDVDDLEWMFKTVLKSYAENRVNKNTIIALHGLGVITDKTKEFMSSIMGTKHKSEKQLLWYDKMSTEMYDKCKKIVNEGIANPNKM